MPPPRKDDFLRLSTFSVTYPFKAHSCGYCSSIQTQFDPRFHPLAWSTSTSFSSLGAMHRTSSDFGVDNTQTIEDMVVECSPQVVGISIRNIDDGQMFERREFLPHIKNLVQTIRRVSEAKISRLVSGLSIMPHEIMRYLDADYGVIGEGEEAFARLLKNLDRAIEIPGVVVRGAPVEMPPVTPDMRGLQAGTDLRFQRSMLNYKSYLSSGSIFQRPNGTRLQPAMHILSRTRGPRQTGQIPFASKRCRRASVSQDHGSAR